MCEVLFPNFRESHEWSLNLANFPMFQTGSSVAWKTMQYVAWNTMAFSIIQQPIHTFCDTMLSYDTPLWQNLSFHNANKHTIPS